MQTMKQLTKSLTLAAALGGLLTVNASAADWPQWRGADRTDHSPDKGLLKKWPEGGPKRAWLNTDVGLGYSGYSIVGGKLFTMGLRDDTEFLIAVDANTGKELWTTKVGAKYENNWGDGPRATPSVDGDRVFTMGGQGDLICVQAGDGKEVWTTSMTKDLGGKLQSWGYTESVLVDGDQVICTPGGSKGTLAALDKLTGKLKWQSAELTVDAQYSSPLVIEHGGKRQYVQLVMNKLFGIEAGSGKLLWQSDWSGRTAVIPTPIYHDGQVYITTGYGVGSKLVNLGADGKATDVQRHRPCSRGRIELRRRGGLGQLGEAEVQDFHVAIAPHHDVLGLDVAVHDPRGMRRRQG